MDLLVEITKPPSVKVISNYVTLIFPIINKTFNYSFRDEQRNFTPQKGYPTYDTTPATATGLCIKQSEKLKKLMTVLPPAAKRSVLIQSAYEFLRCYIVNSVLFKKITLVSIGFLFVFLVSSVLHKLVLVALGEQTIQSNIHLINNAFT